MPIAYHTTPTAVCRVGNINSPEYRGDLKLANQVETRALNQAVARNVKRFPEDFLIVLTSKEAQWLVSQGVIPHIKYLGGHLPNAFTEQGVAMLSSVLSSERALEVNIHIMRAFVKLRQMLNSHQHLARKLAELEKKYDAQFKGVFDAINALMQEPANTPEPKLIEGFKPAKIRRH